MKISSSKKIILFGGLGFTMINFRENLIKDLIKDGHNVFCIAQQYTNEEKTILQNWGATPIDSPLNARGLNPFADIISLRKLIKIIKQIEPDVVFSYFTKPVIFGALAASVCKVQRNIGMIEGLGNAFSAFQESLSNKVKLVKFIQVQLYKIALPKLDALIFLNGDDKKDVIDTYKISVKKISILGGIGLDLNDFSYQPYNEEKVSFIFIARLLKEKGVFEYLQAAEEIKKNNPNITFNLLGGFDENNPFGLKQNDLNEYLEKNIVVYPGHVNNVSEWIQKSGVFVLPSFYREGIPRSTQEAMAIGRPVITTDSVGCRETVEEGVNGYLIKPMSSDELIEKMKIFIKNPSLINKMGLKSREMAEANYDVSKINRRLINIIFNEE